MPLWSGRGPGFLRLVGRRLVSRELGTTVRLTAVPLKMPSLSPTMETGTIVSWAKKEGEEIAPGDVLCEIQTDKAVMAYEMEEEGTLAKILAPEGAADIPVGTLIAVMAEEGEDWKSVEIPDAAASGPKATPSAPSPPPPAPATAPAASTGPQRNDSMIGPAVRLLLEQHGLAAGSVPHSGPHGVLLKGDVLAHIQATGAKPQAAAAPSKPASQAPSAAVPETPSEGYTDIPLTSMRKTIAKRLTESKQQSPHTYASIDVNLSAVGRLRAELKEDGVKVSVNDFIVKAVAAALRAVPEVNVRVGDSGDSVEFMDEVSVSVAVATPSGLITPIVPHTDRLSVVQISDKVKELAGKAKENKLRPEEFMGGTCTVSNLGMFGISEFTAIINPPQAAILAVGGGRLVPDPVTREAVQTARLTLCFDGRGISENSAAAFLATLAEFLSHPDRMATGSLAALAQLAHMGKEYPGGQKFFMERLHRAFAKNADQKDPETVDKLIGHGEFVVKELELAHMGKEYPGGQKFFMERLHRAFAKNADQKDPETVDKLIGHGEFVVKELEALYHVRKYRAMKNRYYTELPPTTPIPKEPKPTL